jgi:hypothetical protein
LCHSSARESGSEMACVARGEFLGWVGSWNAVSQAVQKPKELWKKGLLGPPGRKKSKRRQVNGYDPLSAPLPYWSRRGIVVELFFSDPSLDVVPARVAIARV